MKPHSPLTYRQLVSLFLKMGTQAFGGWSTTLLLIKQTLVPRFIDERELKSIVASSQAIPGANQVIIVAQAGYCLRRFWGAVLAVFSYILPSTVLALLFSIVYLHFSRGIDLSSYTTGLRAGVSGIILANGQRIGKSYVKRHYWLWTLVVLAAAAQWWLGPRVVLVLILYGAMGLVISKRKQKSSHV